MSVQLQVGRSVASVDPALVELLGAWLFLEPFRARGHRGPPAFTVTRVHEREEGAIPLEGSAAEWGFVRFERDHLYVYVPDDPAAAEAALRVLYHVEAVRDGGLLMHSSAVRFGDDAVLASGVSGAGKSTFAGLCAQAGAALLSDEINAVFPSGEVRGTPFRSDLEAPGSPVRTRLASVFTLRKAAKESLSDLRPADAVRAVLSQVYRSPIEPLSAAETLRRVSTIVEKVGVRELAFRKDPEVATFVRDWLA